jgi:hypothetical protein
MKDSHIESRERLKRIEQAITDIEKFAFPAQSPCKAICALAKGLCGLRSPKAYHFT